MRARWVSVLPIGIADSIIPIDEDGAVADGLKLFITLIGHSATVEAAQLEITDAPRTSEIIVNAPCVEAEL